MAKENSTKEAKIRAKNQKLLKEAQKKSKQKNGDLWKILANAQKRMMEDELKAKK